MKLPNKPTLLKKPKDHNEWLQGRSAFLGASEIGTILGLNPFESALELFHRKVGVIPGAKPESLSTYSGHVMEPVIYNSYWKFHDPKNPTHEQLVENAVAGRVIRTAKRKNYTLISREYPWLSCSLDYVIDHNDMHPDGCLDCKNSLQWVVNQYIGGLAPLYLTQMQQQMLITGLKYSELAYLLDGRYPQIFPIAEETTLQETLVRESKAFWLTVEEGRKIWASSGTETERLQTLSQLEPEIDAGEALQDYLKERFKISGKVGKMEGDAEILEIGKKYLEMNEHLGKYEEEKRLYSNTLRKIFIDFGVDEIVFNIPDTKGIRVVKAAITYRNIEGKATLRISKDLLKL